MIQTRLESSSKDDLSKNTMPKGHILMARYDDILIPTQSGATIVISEILTWSSPFIHGSYNNDDIKHRYFITNASHQNVV